MTEPKVSQKTLPILLEVPATLAHRSVVLRTVSAACKLAVGSGTSKQNLEDLRIGVVTAVGEAFNNVAIHGYEGRDPGRMSVLLYSVGDVLHVELKDDSQPFDLQAIKDPTLEDLPESGLGVYLIRTLMDRVEYLAGPPNTLKLSKRIARDIEK
ncbi:MAG: ATP-binding protein [Myxococcales bacterium]|nr:ATP-binding protein [Myxococcales bacterium]